MEKAKSFIEKIKADKKLSLALVLAFTGAAILLAVMPMQKKKSGGPAPGSEENETDYASELSERLTGLIGSVEGAGSVKVMVTLESGEEQVFARDNDTSAETGADGRSNWKEKFEYLVIDGEAVKVKVLTPEVRGVAVVCSGADDEAVRQRITEMLCALLGISASRVSVTKMQQGTAE